MRKLFSEWTILFFIVVAVYGMMVYSTLMQLDTSYSRRRYSYSLSLLRRFFITTGKLGLNTGSNLCDIESAVDRWSEQ